MKKMAIFTVLTVLVMAAANITEAESPVFKSFEPLSLGSGNAVQVPENFIAPYGLEPGPINPHGRTADGGYLFAINYLDPAFRYVDMTGKEIFPYVEIIKTTSEKDYLVGIIIVMCGEDSVYQDAPAFEGPAAGKLERIIPPASLQGIKKILRGEATEI